MIVFPLLPGFRQIPINSDQRFGHTLPQKERLENENEALEVEIPLWEASFSNFQPCVFEGEYQNMGCELPSNSGK